MKKISYTFAMLLMSISMQAQTTDIKAQSIYDVNQDDKVAVSDVTAVVNRLKAPDASSTEKTVVDTQKLIELLTQINEKLNKLDKYESYFSQLGVNTHEYIDLGLSVKWSSCNLGAEVPEDYGLYYAWGDVVGYTSDISDGHTFYWENYKWCDGSENTLTKYCGSSSHGTVDNRTVLESSDDAATANWGGKWRMPTKAEWSELRTNCTWIWVNLNGVNGYKVSGSNGNFIFLPAAGARYKTELSDNGVYGYYWSNTLYDNVDVSIYYFHSNYRGEGCSAPYVGRSVRPVLSE